MVAESAHLANSGYCARLMKVGIGLVAGKTDLLEKTLTVGDWEQNRTASGRSSDQFSRLPSSETKHLGWLWILVEVAALNYVARMMNARLA